MDHRLTRDPPRHHVAIRSDFVLVSTKPVRKRDLSLRRPRARSRRDDTATQLMIERLRCGLTRDELADRAGVSAEMIGDVEEYRCRFPTKAFIEAIRQTTATIQE